MIKEEPETEPEPPEPESKESQTSQGKTEGGTVIGQYPVHNWGVPITTGAYQSTPLEPLKCTSAHGQPVTTGACTTDQLPLQALSEPGVPDGQSTSSRSLKSGEEEDMAVEIPAKTSGTLTQIPLESGSGSLQNLISPKSGSARRRSYKKRSPKQTSVEEEESRKQRRLEKNRQTAAVSRERKRVQFADLQQRVAELEKDNDRLSIELEKRDRQLETAKEELASLTKGASRTGPAQPAFESAVGASVDAMGHPTLVDMSKNLQPDAHLLPLNDQFQILAERRPIGNPASSLRTWASIPDPVASGSFHNNSDSYDLARSESVAQERGPYVDRQSCQQQTPGLERQDWGQFLAPQYQHQARLEVDYGGPILSLGNCETVNSLNYPDKETDQLLDRNPSVQSQAGHNLKSQIQNPYTQI